VSSRALGPFDILEPIAAGGVGRVMLGRHRRQGVQVAIKVLTASAARHGWYLSAFDDEVRAAARLDHPSVVRIYDFGRLPEGIELDGAAPGSPYLVMEYVRGETLYPYRGRLGWVQLKQVLLRLLDALAHAHARGVIHRDLKPGNVLLSESPPRVVLTDFGLAHARGKQVQGSRPEAIIGTPAYMAPEQLRGSWRDQGPWTDLYGLGCLAWTLATGAPPFGFGRRDNADLIRAQLEDTPPPLAPAVPVGEGFQEWLLGLLEKSTRRRFRNAADAARELMTLGDPRPSRPPAAVSLPEDELPTRIVGVKRAGEDTTMMVAASRPRLASSARGLPEAPPGDWRRGEPPRPDVRLVDVGLTLYGLRVPPLVGREAEQDRLWRAFLRVWEERRPAMVLVRGAPGSGASRLVAWLAERLEELGLAENLRATHGADPGADDGLGPMLARLLRSQGLDAGETRRRAQRYLELIGRGGGGAEELAALATQRAQTSSGAQPGGSGQRHEVLAGFLQRLSKPRPVLVCLDELHWGADAARFAARLLEQPAEESPILLVATVSDEALASRPVAARQVARLRAAGVEEIVLEPLSQGCILELIDRMLPLERPLAEKIVARSGGNPMLALQLLGHQLEQARVTPSERGFRLVRGASLALPADLRTLWEARVERALKGRSAPAASALELAAVLGGELRGEEWVEACAQAGLPVPWSLIYALMREQLVEAAPGGATQGWRFAHELLRDTLERRAEWGGRLQQHHWAAAKMLSLLGGERERQARHWLKAAAWAEAAPLLLEAALARSRRGELEESEGLLDGRRLALYRLNVPETDPRWARDWLARSAIDDGRADTVSGEAHARRALELARRRRWPEVEREALRLLGRHVWMQGRLEEARDYTEAALAAAVDGGDASLSALCRRDRGEQLAMGASLERARALLTDARAQFRTSGDDVEAGKCALGLAVVSRKTGEKREAREWLSRARLHFKRCDHSHGAIRCDIIEARLLRVGGALGAADRLLRESAARMEALGQRPLEARLNLAMTVLDGGRPREARALLVGEAAVADEGCPHGLYAAWLHAMLLPCLVADKAWVLFDTHLEITERLLQGAGVVDEDIAGCLEDAADWAEVSGAVGRAASARALAKTQRAALSRGSAVSPQGPA